MAALLLGSASAHAFPSFTDTTPGNLTNGAISDAIRTVGIGADHRPYQSANPLGLVIGLDVGIDVTAVAVPQSFKNAMSLAGNTDKVPDLVFAPRINLRKGLPWGIDVGTSFIGFDNARLFGIDVQYALLDDKLPANLAVRGSYNTAKLWYLKATTFAFDLVGSVKIPLIAEPYVGVGWQVGSGQVDIPATQLASGVSGNQSFSNTRFFVGLPISFTILHLTFEYGYSTANISTYGAKVSLAL